MSTITTHILDTARGCPAEAVRVILYRKADSAGDVEIAAGYTNKDGRIAEWVRVEGEPTLPGDDDGGNAEDGLDAARNEDRSSGIYKIRFKTRDYFDGLKVDSFYPWVDIYFEVAAEGHYHVPLLISPYGYSTYRGS